LAFYRLKQALLRPKTLKPYVSIFCSWHSARGKADLAALRFHELRHSDASFLVNDGRDIFAYGVG
jgi:hypothetical protein